MVDHGFPGQVIVVDHGFPGQVIVVDHGFPGQVKPKTYVKVDIWCFSTKLKQH